MTGPTVSVVIPSYNHERYVGQAVESVLAQDLPPLEVLVVDDGSTDGTAELVRRFGEPVRFFDRPHSGIAPTYNFALGAAAGVYVAVLESDDQWEPTYLREAVDYLERHPDVVLLTTARRVIDGDGCKTGELIRKRTPGDRFTTEGILLRDWMSVPTPVFRRARLAEIGPHDERLPFGCDTEMGLRVSLRFPMGHLDRPLYLYRRHGANTSGDRLRVIREALAVLDRFTEKTPALPARVARAVHRRYGGLYGRLGKALLCKGPEERAAAVEALRRAVAHSPLRLRNYPRLLWALARSR